MNSLEDVISTIINYQNDKEQAIKNMVEKNAKLTKVIANIRSVLERTLKNPATLNNAVYECIDLCRANFVYMDYSSGKTKMDAPLTDIEKVLP